MTQQEERRGEGFEPEKRAPDYAAEGKERPDDFSDARNQIWDRLQDANRIWLERMQHEAALTAELASKLTSSRSFSETASVLQSWTAKHIELATEDARRLFDDAQQMQQMMTAGARFWSTSAERSGPEAGARFFS